MEEDAVVEELKDVDGECAEVMRPWVGLQRLVDYSRSRSTVINSSTSEMSLNQTSGRGFALLVSKTVVKFSRNGPERRSGTCVWRFTT